MSDTPKNAHEEWRDVRGYEGRYQVSNYGRVRSVQYKGSPRIYVLKPCYGSTRYPLVTLVDKDGKSRNEHIHRMVAEAFIPNPDNLPYVMHIDESRTNCYVDNLKWGTGIENGNTPLRLQRLHNRSKTNGIAKAVVCCGLIFDTIKDCSEYFHVNYRNMNRWLLGTRPIPKEFKAKGLHYYEAKI